MKTKILSLLSGCAVLVLAGRVCPVSHNAEGLSTLCPAPLRGFAADLLFHRLKALQNEKRYGEINALSQSLIILQKWDAGASFLAWNLAYNLSREFPDPQSRYAWIERAFDLLLEQRSRYGASAQTDFTIAFICLDKLGSSKDPDVPAFRTCYGEHPLNVPLPMRHAVESLIHAPDWHLPETAALAYCLSALACPQKEEELTAVLHAFSNKLESALKKPENRHF